MKASLGYQPHPVFIYLLVDSFRDNEQQQIVLRGIKFPGLITLYGRFFWSVLPYDELRSGVDGTSIVRTGIPPPVEKKGERISIRSDPVQRNSQQTPNLSLLCTNVHQNVPMPFKRSHAYCVGLRVLLPELHGVPHCTMLDVSVLRTRAAEPVGRRRLPFRDPWEAS